MEEPPLKGKSQKIIKDGRIIGEESDESQTIVWRVCP
jgi:hypothetical protein